MTPTRDPFDRPHFHDEDAARAFVEGRLWPDGPVCPGCGEQKRVSRMAGASTRSGTLKCYACRRRFSVVTGTPFAGSPLPLTVWLRAIHLVALEERLTSGTLQRRLGVTRKTGVRLWHELRRARRAARMDQVQAEFRGDPPSSKPTILALWPEKPHDPPA